MKTQTKHIPVANNLALVAIKERRLMRIKNAGKTAFSITWKAVVYAFILTLANIII
ncbi:MAG: hypothetical protein IKF17_02370 [Clostridia bacterium]|nr:hypothetical protein [Clostridia bacterium]